VTTLNSNTPDGRNWARQSARVLSDPYVAAALDIAERRIGDARSVEDTRLDPYGIPQSVAEAVFWLAAVDEALWPVQGYAEVRDSHDGGRLLPGIRLARNGAVHSLVPPTAPADVRPFISKPGDSYVLFISSVVHWPAEPPRTTRKPTLAQLTSYRNHLANQPVDDTLRAALRWLRGLQSKTDETRDGDEAT